MSNDSSADSDIPIEYRIFEIGVRESLGRIIAEATLSEDCTEHSMPVDIPEIQDLMDTIRKTQDKIPKKGILRKATIERIKALTMVEEMLPDVEKLLLMTSDFYAVNREIILDLRAEYHPDCHDSLEESETPELSEKEESKKSKALGKIRDAYKVVKGVLDYDPTKHPEPVKDLKVEIGSEYFKKLTERVEKDTILDYISTLFSTVRSVSELAQMDTEELSSLEKWLLQKGEAKLMPYVTDQLNRAIYSYTMNSNLVSGVVDTLLGIIDLEDLTLVDESLTWLENTTTYAVDSLYENPTGE